MIPQIIILIKLIKIYNLRNKHRKDQRTGRNCLQKLLYVLKFCDWCNSAQRNLVS